MHLIEVLTTLEERTPGVLTLAVRISACLDVPAGSAVFLVLFRVAPLGVHRNVGLLVLAIAIGSHQTGLGHLGIGFVCCLKLRGRKKNLFGSNLGSVIEVSSAEGGLVGRNWRSWLGRSTLVSGRDAAA